MEKLSDKMEKKTDFCGKENSRRQSKNSVFDKSLNCPLSENAQRIGLSVILQKTTYTTKCIDQKVVFAPSFVTR